MLGLVSCNSPSVKKEVNEIIARVKANSQRFQKEMIENMLIPKLRKNITMNHAVEITQALFGHLTDKYTKLYSNYENDFNEIMDRMLKELDEYIDIIKHGIYE